MPSRSAGQLSGNLPAFSQWKIRLPAPKYNCNVALTSPKEADMHDTKERLSLFWIFALLNYLYADVVALFAIID